MHVQASTFMCALYSFFICGSYLFHRSFFLQLCETLYMHSVVYTHRLDNHESLLESFVSDCAYLQVQTQFHAVFKA
jgi:hypothetical protein